MNPTTINDTLTKFEIGEQDIQAVKLSADLLTRDVDAHIERFYEWLSNHKEYEFFFGQNPERLHRVKRMQRNHWMSLFNARLDEEWFANRKHLGAVHAHIEVPNEIYFSAMSFSCKSLVDQVMAPQSNYPNPAKTASALTKLVFLDSYLVIDEIVRIQKEKVLASAQALSEMSTPVTPIWDGILLLPLVGILDSTRTQDVMTKTLNKIAESRAKVFVLDISGVGAIDTSVANQLLKITKATQLMGCETIVSGLSPAIAQTLVELGVNVGEVRTTATLRDSFELALRTLGLDRKIFASNG